MQRLEYHLTVQSDQVVYAELDTGKEKTRARGQLALAGNLEVVQDYLPILEKDRMQSRDLLVRFGTRLYQMLLPPPISGHFEEQAWRKVDKDRERYRLALSLTLQEGLRADVASLPWEFLYCPREHDPTIDTFLAADWRVAFSRRPVDWESPPLLPSGNEPLRVLLVRLQPRGVNSVALTRIRNVLRDLAKENESRILPPLVLENQSPLDIKRELCEFKPHIFHLAAHGYFQDRGTSFAFVDDSGQSIRQYRDRSLADLFQVHQPWLALLQACEGGRRSDLHSFTKEAPGAARLMNRYVPTVIAMHYAITNEGAWRFAEELYTRLIAGDELDVAAQVARSVLGMLNDQSSEDYASRDFGGTLLWMKSQPFEEDPVIENVRVQIKTPDGGLYEADVSSHILVNELLQGFLNQWQPPANEEGSRRYAFRLDSPDSPELNVSETLLEAGIGERPNLGLVSGHLTSDSPVGLVIEDAQGQRYTTAVLLSTSINHLAKAFFASNEATPGKGTIVVELVGGLPGAETTRRLDLNRSLYEEGVHDYAKLRIYRYE